MIQKKLTILGAGESGMGAAILAKKLGLEVFISDKGSISPKDKKELKELDIEFEEGEHSKGRILESDLIVKSPGIPENTEIIKAIRSNKIELISEPEFASRYYNGKIIAITGTNGKTTTTLLTYHLLKEAGLNVGLAGNVGVSFARQVAREHYDIYVLEISSFQLDDIDRFKPDIAVLLNITPDHLDRYDGKMENYAAAKFKISSNLDFEGHFIYNFDDELIRNKYRSAKGFIKWPVSQEGSGKAAYLENKHRLHFDCQGDFDMDLRESPLIGKHNIYNTMCAFIAARLMGVDWELLKKSLKSFKNAEHRLEFVREIDGVTFINDSKATNVDSSYYALEGVKAPIIWIAGGVDKGNKYKELRPFTDKVKTLICLGKNNKKLLRYFERYIERIEEFEDVNKAVKKAQKIAKEGDTVLLSPACASFDLFKNYIDRGEKFKAAVKALKSKKALAK